MVAALKRASSGTAVPTLASTVTAAPVLASTEPPTATASPTVPFTPTFTPTPTLTPTPPLLVLAGTPLPVFYDAINIDNASRVSGLAEWRQDTVTDLAWLPDGRILVGASPVGITFYDVPTRRVLRSLYPRSKGIVDIALSPRGTWLVAGSRWGDEKTGYISSLELWRGPNWKPLGVLYGVGRAINSMDFSPDEKYFAAAFSSSIYDQNSVEFWNTLTWKITGTLQTGTVLNVAFSPAGRWLAFTPDRYAIRIWDMGEQKWSYKLSTSFTGAVNKIAFSPDGLTLASGHYDGTIRLWDMKTGNLLQTMQTEEVIESLAFSPDGSLLASGGSYKNSLVRLWQVSSGKLLQSLEGHASGVGYLAFAPTSQLLASGSYDGTIRVWGIRP